MSTPDSPQTSTAKPSKAGSLRRRLALAVGGVLLLVGVLAYWIVPSVVETQLVEWVEAELGVTPRVEGVSFSPFDLRLTLRGFELPDPKGDASIVAFETLAVDLRLLGFLSADVALEEVLLVGPRISAVVDRNGALNLQALASRLAEAEDAESPPEEAASESLIVDIGAIRIKGGFVRFEDRSQQPAFTVDVTPFDLEILDFSTRASEEAPYTLEVRVGNETELRWGGSLAMDPVRSKGEVSLSGFDLRLPGDYASERVRFDVESGVLGVDFEYELNLGDGETKGLSLAISDGRVELADVEILDREDDSRVVTLPSLLVEGVAVEAGQAGLESLALASIALRGGRLASRLEADGSVHLVDLFTPVSPGTSPTAGAEEAGTPQAQEAAPTATAPSPEIRIDRIAIQDFDLDFEDRSRERAVPIQLAPLDLRVEGYSSEPGAALQLALTSGFGEGGKLAVEGPLTIEPFSTQLAIEASEIGLGDFQPYLEDVARLEVTSGSLSTKLALNVKGGEGEASAPLAVEAQGWVELNRFVSLDRRLSKKFVEWEGVRLDGLSVAPTAIRVEEVALSGLLAHIAFDRAGRSNLDAIFGTEAADSTQDADPSDSAAASPLAIEIGKISLSGLGVDLDDQSMDPEFVIALGELEGTIEGLSSSPQSRARVRLDALVDGVAPVHVEGRLNPLATEMYTDLAMKVTGVSMPAFSPYSGRFVGYQIDRGKLDLDLDYELDQGHLKAKNKVSLRKFDFGESVESEQATALPVVLAAALLKNPAGDIEIDLPVEGDVDDPSFSFLEVLGKTLVNLITRVATSPFSVVAGIVGATGEDLSRVDFEPGSTELSEIERAELEKISLAVADRDELKVEVRGRADPEAEAPALRAQRIDEEVRGLAFDALSRREREGLKEASALSLAPADRLSILTRLYKERVGGRLEDAFPAPAAQSADDRTDRLIEVARQALGAQVELAPADWRKLARARGAAIEAALLSGGQLTSDRVFLVEIEVGPFASEGRVAAELSLSPQ